MRNGGIGTSECLNKGERVNSTAQNSDAGIQKSLPTPRFALKFRDIEDSIRKFGGDDTLSIEVWLEDFEDTAQVIQRDDLQVYIFTERSLKGLAQMFVARETQFKKCLVERI